PHDHRSGRDRAARRRCPPAPPRLAAGDHARDRDRGRRQRPPLDPRPRRRRARSSGRAARRRLVRYSMRRSLVLIGLPALVSAVAVADVPPGRDRARTYLMLRVVDALNLSDEKALAMREVLRHADDRRIELTSKRDALETRLRTALGAQPIDEPGLAKLVAD